MLDSYLPKFPYGAVYFRKSNPPREDWSRDYAVAAEDGYTLFRHWFPWAAIEIAPGVYDWDDFDRQLDLAAENGIKTIVAATNFDLNRNGRKLTHAQLTNRHIHRTGFWPRKKTIAR